MNTYTIKVSWTDWIRDDSPHWDASDVLYMYASRKEPIYVGEAGDSTVWKRYLSHEDDGVLDWIFENIHNDWDVKVGYLSFPSDMNFTLAKLFDIQTLIIYLESKARGFCRANIANTKTRDKSRLGMIVLNDGEYHPLVKRYHDKR